MRIKDMQDFDVRQSSLLKTLGAGEGAARTSKAETVPVSTDQAGATAYRGLVALALQVTDPAQTSRVEELRTQIQTGQYSLDLPDVSRAIVDGALNRD